MSKLTDFYSQLAASVGMRYDSENNVIYGQKEGFELVVYAADRQVPYALTIHTAAKTPTGTAFVSEDFKNLSKSVSTLSVGGQSGNNIAVPLMNIINQRKLRDALPERLREALNGLVAFLKERGCIPCCSVCGRAEEVTAYVSGASYLHLCPDCETKMRGSAALAEQEKAKKKENMVGGIVGAVLGSLVGVLSIVLLSQLGYVAALSGAVMAIGVLKGYELLGGRLTKKGIVISIVVMLAMTYFGDRLDWAIRMVQEGIGDNVFSCYRAVSRALKVGIIEKNAYLGNLALLYMFLLLGAVPTIINRVREKKTEGRLAKIGSSAGYGSYAS